MNNVVISMHLSWNLRDARTASLNCRSSRLADFLTGVFLRPSEIALFAAYSAKLTGVEILMIVVSNLLFESLQCSL